MDTIEELAALLGRQAVSARPEELDWYSHDAWPVSRKEAMQGKHAYRPEAVVRVRDCGQVVELLRWANTFGVAITPRGLGSSVTGAPLPLRGGVVLDLSELDGPVDIDETDLTVTVPAGIRGDDLEARLSGHGYTLGHSPQSLNRSSVGGWLATRATGQFSSASGGIEDLIVGFTAVLASGETVVLPRHPRAAMGPDLRHVFLGSEGTLGVITEATLKIFPVAEHRQLQTVRFANVEDGLAAMRQITRAGLRPFLVRFYDEDESRRVLADSGFEGCVLFLGSEGVREVVEAEYLGALTLCERENGKPIGDEAVRSWLHRRFDFSMIEGFLNTPGGYAETIEIAHSWSRIEKTYREAKAALTPLADEVLGHFSHVYPQGTSLYLIVLGQLANDAAAETRIRDVWSITMRIAAEHGAALSHHHGVGLARLPYLDNALGSSSVLLQRIQNCLDPNGILNPGKLGAS